MFNFMEPICSNELFIIYENHSNIKILDFSRAKKQVKPVKEEVFRCAFVLFLIWAGCNLGNYVF